MISETQIEYVSVQERFGYDAAPVSSRDVYSAFETYLEQKMEEQVSDNCAQGWAENQGIYILIDSLRQKECLC